MFGQSINVDGIKSLMKILRNPDLLIPKLQVADIRQISFCSLKNSGIKAIAFDKDNTITAPYKQDIHSPFVDSFEEAKAIFGDRVCIISNSAGSKDDIGYKQAMAIEKSSGVKVLRSNFKKPSLEHAKDLSNYFSLEPGRIAIVGDRLLTDVVYANRIGAYSIYCRNIITTEGDNRVAAFLRYLEHIYIDRYR